jgi:hypothetical protein
MPVSRRRSRKRKGELTWVCHMELDLGPRGRDQSEFPSDEARKEAYFANRPRLLDDIGPGSRPWAFWRYESPRFPDHAIFEDDAEALVVLGLADPEDWAAFVATMAYEVGAVQRLAESGVLTKDRQAAHERRLALLAEQEAGGPLD